MTTGEAVEGSTALRPGKLGRADLEAIGRIIRGAAEIEDVLFLYVSRLAGLQPAHAVLLLRRNTITKQLELAKKFGKTKGRTELDKQNLLFATDDFARLLHCRNAVAHGTFVGCTPGGRFCFLVAREVTIDEVELSQEVTSFSSGDLKENARYIEHLVKLADVQLMVGEVRKDRFSEILKPDPNKNKRKGG